jgi:hypothetical protein
MTDLDYPKETPEQRATRRWGNADLTRRFREEKHKPPLEPTKKVIEVLSIERPKADVTTKFERQFIKDLRVMLEGHKQRNMEQYRRALLARLYKLKLAKFRRLEAQQNQKFQRKDLFS